MFYFLLQSNNQQVGDVSRTKLQATVAVSRMVGEEKLKDSHYMRESLEAVVAYCGREQNESRLPVAVVDGVVQQISSLIRYNEQLANNRNDTELLSELYLKFSNSYAHSPAMRITWLENLASLHSSVCRLLHGIGKHTTTTTTTAATAAAVADTDQEIRYRDQCFVICPCALETQLGRGSADQDFDCIVDCAAPRTQR
jgi:hypothetical protein